MSSKTNISSIKLPWKRLAGWFLLLGVALAISGWTWFWESTSREEGWFGRGYVAEAHRDIRQNHQIHVVKEEIECAECHEGAKTTDLAGMPKESACADCHDEQTSREGTERKGCLFCHELEKPVEGCTAAGCPKEKLPAFTPRLGPEPYKNLRYPTGKDGAGFSHKKHFKAEIPCASCHGEVAKETTMPFPSGKYMPQPQRCFDCHAKDLERFSHPIHKDLKVDCEDCHEDDVSEKKMPGADYVPTGAPNSTPETCRDCHEPLPRTCDSCHKPGTYDKEVKPPDHDANWKGFHGGVAVFNEEGSHGKDCLTCHTQDACASCHSTEAPDDHTNFWRTRAHGFMAAGNEERCSTCHQQDFCERCHNETAPLTHIGNWGADHCPTCHLSSSMGPQEGCLACHKEALHVTAPHGVNSAADCLSCH